MQTRSFIARLINSKAALVGLTTAVILAVAGTTFGYAALNRTVTLSLDGKEREVSVMGGTVGELLESEGVDVGERDQVAPGLDEEISDGSAVSVRFARPLELTVDGETDTHWVTATDVSGALSQLGSRFAGADLSVSRGGSIDRDGMSLDVVTEKKLKVKIADKKVESHQIPALTARDALTELGVKIDKHDEITPGKKKQLEDGDRVVYTDVDIRSKRVKAEEIGFDTVEREAPAILEGESETVRSGKPGTRDVTYRQTFRNGNLVTSKLVRQEVVREPVDAVVKIGTKQPAPEPEPEPEPAAEPAAPNFAGGSTVWDQLAQCESGGNWAINTGNGYYGGLQFNLGTWQSYGGPGLPHQQSRETQIAIAEKVRAATGGYGSWPACSQSLGLPQ